MKSKMKLKLMLLFLGLASLSYAGDVTVQTDGTVVETVDVQQKIDEAKALVDLYTRVLTNAQSNLDQANADLTKWLAVQADAILKQKGG